MVGDPNQEATEGARRLRRTYERLDARDRRPQSASEVKGSPVRPEIILESIRDAFFVLDRDWRYVYANGRCAALFETTPEKLIGRTIWETLPNARDSRFRRECVRAIEEGTAVEFEEYHDPPGRWFLCRCRPAGDALTVLLADITEHRQMQGAVRELERRAHQLRQLSLELSNAEDRERKRLAEVLHDDLQQVLAAAKFHLGMLSSRLRGDEALQELTGQIGGLLKEAIAKSRNLSHELSPAVLYHDDLGETFEWLARHLQAKHGLIVHVEVRGRVEPRSEPLRTFLYRTAREMLFNVVKHSGVAEARLRLQYVRDHVWLTIADRGRGFDPGALAETGGFGLFNVRERVQLLGGRMRIRSAPGRGSTFFISVPDRELASMAPVPAPAEPPAAHPQATEDCAHDWPGRPLRVLLVDDHRIVREGLAALLDVEPDIDVVGQAADGREAVAMAKELQPDVIVMDVAMPVMGGDEATRRIKRHSPRTRVIALSMFEGPRAAKRMRRAGAEAHLLKTSPVEELLWAIRGGRGAANRDSPPAAGP